MNYRTIITSGAALLLAVIARAELPATITTTDGQTYNGVSLIRTEPDGYLVNYEPVPHGMGMAKIKFSRLAEDLQKQAGYSPDKAREFEASVAKANDALAQASLKWDESARAAQQARQAREDQFEMQRMALAMQFGQPQAAEGQAASPGWTWSSLAGGYGYGPYIVAKHTPPMGFTQAPHTVGVVSEVPARGGHR